ncbi:hypothetical protein PTNB73_00084 [Pyrenophora teres f. teres]|uniref:Heterokaryon incompatibility domain-containing protein n=1 Tax=Pyrenophora teres f. teres (strain 0-1) TaxID=861557 RepID=E3RL76_PYRTT|nr:hypothetical protein PTT_09101 [Pyrenophora teres f. teres 0-1]KAE8851067.1 hypothetical protein HRS9122_01354 [Pyrenophora teres f. teres]KAE8873452.1 hypothetical protein PTNB73_00084 [Pyrenophora teres f. teres]
MATPTTEVPASHSENFQDLEELKRYCHQALDTTSQQIRLVKLHPHRDEPLQLDIETFDLENAPEFVALSYTWGPESPTFDIVVNNRPFSVRKNLYRFLQAYEEDKYLWVDQICIDQLNVLERNHQVGLMTSIYSQCSSVTIWLGRFHKRPRAPIIFNSTQSVEALAVILQQSYFTRLWFVQEVLLARRIDVLCSHASIGNVWICWDDMCRIVEQSRSALEMLNVPKSALSILKNYGTRATWTLLGVFFSFGEGYCQDPRDKIYGLMGLVKIEHRLQVDYRKSLYDILIDVVKTCDKLYTHIFDLSGNRLYWEDCNPPLSLTENCYTYLPYVESLHGLSIKLGIPPPHSDTFRSCLEHIWSRFDIWSRVDWSHRRLNFITRDYPLVEMGFTLSSSADNSSEISTPLPYMDESRSYWWYIDGGRKYEFYYDGSTQSEL